MTTITATQSFRRETDLVVSVARYLRNRAFRQQLEEVPFYEYRMDMYVYSRRDDMTLAVELKLKKWPRAFEQALLYQLCSDLVYIALPYTEVRKVDTALLLGHGIGLLAVEAHRCREVLQASPSQEVRRHYREKYLEMIQEGL